MALKMVVRGMLLPVLLALAMVPATAVEEGLGEGLVNPGYVEKPDWFKDSFLDLQEDVAEAAAEGRRLMLYFHQDGCPYCATLIEDLHSRSLAEKAQSHFDVVEINMWGDREVVDLEGVATTEKQFSESMKVLFTPTILFLNESGEGVIRMNGYYPPHQFTAVLDYVGRHLEEKITFQEHYAKLNPVQPSAALHHEPGWGRAPIDLRALSESDRPKLLLFEQKRCGSCDELHQDILRRPEIRSDLERFDVVLLDIWGDQVVTLPDGEQLRERDWAKRLKIQFSPTLLFLDQEGYEVFRTEAYLKAFHTHSAMQYVLTGSYREQPNFQRFVQSRADALHEQGIEVDLMK